MELTSEGPFTCRLESITRVGRRRVFPTSIFNRWFLPESTGEHFSQIVDNRPGLLLLVALLCNMNTTRPLADKDSPNHESLSKVVCFWRNFWTQSLLKQSVKCILSVGQKQSARATSANVCYQENGSRYPSRQTEDCPFEGDRPHSRLYIILDSDKRIQNGETGTQTPLTFACASPESTGRCRSAREGSPTRAAV